MRRMFWIVCSLALGLAIVYLSLTPGVTFRHGSDKIAHFVAYGAWTAASLMITRVRLVNLAILALAFSVGIGIEIIQPYMGRTGSLKDVVANAAGLIAGASAAFVMLRPLETWFLGKLKKRRRTRAPHGLA